MKFQVNLELLVTVEADNPADAWDATDKLLPALNHALAMHVDWGPGRDSILDNFCEVWEVPDSIEWADPNGETHHIFINTRFNYATGESQVTTREDIIRQWEEIRGQDKQETP